MFLHREKSQDNLCGKLSRQFMCINKETYIKFKGNRQKTLSIRQQNVRLRFCARGPCLLRSHS
jgi:hypothetical protein